jgi:hypothetical protein
MGDIHTLSPVLSPLSGGCCCTRKKQTRARFLLCINQRRSAKSPRQCKSPEAPSTNPPVYFLPSLDGGGACTKSQRHNFDAGRQAGRPRLFTQTNAAVDIFMQPSRNESGDDAAVIKWLAHTSSAALHTFGACAPARPQVLSNRRRCDDRRFIIWQAGQINLLISHGDRMAPAYLGVPVPPVFMQPTAL